LLTGVIQTGADAFAKDVPFELCKHGVQASHGAARWCSQIERFRQRYETHAEMLQFLKCRNQVCDGPAPAIQAPHQHDIDFTAASSSDQSFALLALGRAGADLFDLRDDGPVSFGRVFAHGADLQRQRLLIMGGNAGIQSDPKGVAKNLPGNRGQKLAICGHFRRVAESGQKLMIMARQDS